MASRTRYALVGTGSRAQMYLDAIAGPHADVAELRGVERHQRRAPRLVRRGLQAGRHPALLRGSHRMASARRRAASTRIDRVIVTSPDWTHARHVVAALEAGADVIVEKPLTTTRGGRAPRSRMPRSAPVATVIVTFNYRYSPRNSALEAGRGLGRDRRGDLGPLRVGARHVARRGLLPPVAPREGRARAGC